MVGGGDKKVAAPFGAATDLEGNLAQVSHSDSSGQSVPKSSKRAIESKKVGDSPSRSCFRSLGAEGRVLRFNYLIDEFQSFIERGEGTLHRIYRKPLEVVDVPVEGLGELHKLFGH